MRYNIKKYQSQSAKIWNDFINRSANGTFLHQRDYMDYHAERFTDFSLMIYEGEKLKAVLPAHRIKNVLYAHNGLTYSDFIFHFKAKLEHKIAIIQTALQYLNEHDITKLYIKTIPFIFGKITDQSNEYIYHQLQAGLISVKPFFVYLKRNEIKPNRNRLKNIKKLAMQDYKIVQGKEKLSDFWKLVEHNLKSRYQSHPVHSLEEMEKLINNFPEQIKLYSLLHKNQILAGALVYYINNALHFQYIHSVLPKEERMAVEWLIYDIVNRHAHFEYISFGTSAVENNNLNKGLAYWKQSFGSVLINQYHYEISTHNYQRLNEVLQ